MPVIEDPHSNSGKLQIFLRGLCSTQGTQEIENLTADRYFPVFFKADQILPLHAGAQTPSVFKKSAAFILAFLQESPLRYPFQGDQPWKKHKNHQNAIAAFEYSRFALEKSVIKHSSRGRIELSNRIKVSDHYYCDLIHALAHLPKEETCFHTLSILMESLCYNSNPDAQDPERF